MGVHCDQKQEVEPFSTPIHFMQIQKTPAGVLLARAGAHGRDGAVALCALCSVLRKAPTLVNKREEDGKEQVSAHSSAPNTIEPKHTSHQITGAQEEEEESHNREGGEVEKAAAATGN